MARATSSITTNILPIQNPVDMDMVDMGLTNEPMVAPTTYQRLRSGTACSEQSQRRHRDLGRACAEDQPEWRPVLGCRIEAAYSCRIRVLEASVMQVSAQGGFLAIEVRPVCC